MHGTIDVQHEISSGTKTNKKAVWHQSFWFRGRKSTSTVTSAEINHDMFYCKNGKTGSERPFIEAIDAVERSKTLRKPTVCIWLHTDKLTCDSSREHWPLQTPRSSKRRDQKNTNCVEWFILFSTGCTADPKLVDESRKYCHVVPWKTLNGGRRPTAFQHVVQTNHELNLPLFRIGDRTSLQHFSREPIYRWCQLVFFSIRLRRYATTRTTRSAVYVLWLL